MILKNILNEGGGYGHMSHIYENGSLTFAQIKDIFQKAASGELIGTEKTDGQNMMVSFSVKDGKAKGATSPGEPAKGGLTAEELHNKYASHKNPNLKYTFADALKIFEKAMKYLSTEEQIKLFGENVNIFYNCEVMDPRTPNVVNYDTKALVIHRAGHQEYDENRKQTGRDLTDEGNIIEQKVLSLQEKIKDENYGLQVNAVKKLEALSNKEVLTNAIKTLDTILAATNYSAGTALNNNSSINEFMLARVKIVVDSILAKGVYEIGEVKPAAKLKICKRILGFKGNDLPEIYKDLTPKEKIFVRQNIFADKKDTEIKKKAIEPVEDLISDFASEMLKTLKSVFVLDNSKEVKRIQAMITAAIEEIKKDKDEEFLKVLNRQMQKLKSVEKITAAAEGFVFDYDGYTYKFTGNFAPLNQINGIIKYRKEKKATSKQDISETKKKTQPSPVKKIIAVYAGRFQPMGQHHVQVFKAAQQEFGEENTYITTSDIVKMPKSPLNFLEKKTLMIQQDVPSDKIINEHNPYKPVQFLSQFDQNTTAVVYIIGKKDMSGQDGEAPRFKITDANNYEKNKEAGTFKPLSENAYYVYVAPHVVSSITVTTEKGEEKEIKFESGTEIRKMIAQGDKNIFRGILGIFNPGIYNLLVKKFKESEAYVEPVKPAKVKKTTKKKKEVKENFINDTIYEILNENIFNSENYLDVTIVNLINERIEKKGKKYCLLSKQTGKNLGCYRSRKGAIKREKQVQYFKHIKEMSAAGGPTAAVQGPAGRFPFKLKKTKKEEDKNE